MQGEEQAEVEEKRPRLSIAAILALLAGAGVVVGSLLQWVRGPSAVVAFQGGNVAGSPEGLKTIYGIAALVGGVLVILSALAWLARRHGSRLVSFVVLIGGAASTTVAGFYLATLESRYVDFAVDQAASPKLPAAKIRDLLSRALKADVYKIDAGVGLYVVLVAGAIAVVIGLVTLVRGPRPVEQPTTESQLDT